MNGGLMGQIANPYMADIVGAQDYRKQKLAEDEQKRKEIRMNQMIADALPSLRKGGKLHRIFSEDAQSGMTVMQALGIPMGEAGQLQQFADDTRYLSALPKQQAFEEMGRLVQEREAMGLSPGPLANAMNAAMRDGVNPTYEALRYYAGALNDPDDEKPAALLEFESLTEGLSDEDKLKARRIKLGLDGRAQGSSAVTIAQEGLTDLVADSESRISGAKKSAESTAQGNADRAQDFINRGVAAAESVPTLKRSLTLLDSIETGGFENALLNAQKMFGIEGADAGELSANLGRAVLSQLRDTFGAAFTENEGERLEKIEASFGKSTSTNRRLIEQALAVVTKKAERGLNAAREAGDDFTVQDIEDYLSFTLDPKPERDKPSDSQAPRMGGQTQNIDDLLNKYAPRS